MGHRGLLDSRLRTGVVMLRLTGRARCRSLWRAGRSSSVRSECAHAVRAWTHDTQAFVAAARSTDDLHGMSATASFSWPPGSIGSRDERFDAGGIGIVDGFAVLADQAAHRHAGLGKPLFTIAVAGSPGEPGEALAGDLPCFVE